ncbi:nucleotidyltransferase domain-containing protein [Paenibacillus antri]|nr:nucleotidyltransferase family protein [Paenibacillus antri]
MRLLLRLLRTENIEDIDQALGKASAEIDWGVFIRLIAHHRVYPFLYNRLKSSPAVPKGTMQWLTWSFRQNTIQMLHLAAEMEQIGVQLHGLGVPVLFLKGPVLAAELYGGLSLRTSCDLDFLVPIERLEEVERFLEGRGYCKDDYIQSVLGDWKWRHHHVTFHHPEKGIKAEVHWRLHPGPAKEPHFLELWQRRRKSSVTSFPVNMLGLEDLLLFLSMHGARHGWSRLRWLVDIDRVARKKLDPALLEALMKGGHCAHVVGQAVRLAGDLLGTPLSGRLAVLAASKRSKLLAKAAEFYLRDMVNLHTEPVPEPVSRYHKRHLFDLMSFPHKCLFLLSFLFPYHEDAKTMPLPKPLHWLYFPLRPLLWAWRKAGLAARSEGG